MSLLDDYLRCVEGGLRCPAERRPAIIEELGAHLRDRVEALVGQGVSPADAERRATREMGAAWLLALRLSAANGWSVTAHVFREIWAMGIGMEIAAFATFGAVSVAPRFWLYKQGGTVSGIDSWVYMWGPYLLLFLLLTALPAFGFAMGRLVRGWLWAIPPGLVLAHQARPIVEPPWVLAVFVLAALALLAAALAGARREAPHWTWLAWASGLVLAVFGVGWPAALPEVGLTDVPGALAALLSDVPPVDLILDSALLTFPWVLLVAAWLLDREAHGRLAGTAG